MTQIVSGRLENFFKPLQRISPTYPIKQFMSIEQDLSLPNVFKSTKFKLFCQYIYSNRLVRRYFTI